MKLMRIVYLLFRGDVSLKKSSFQLVGKPRLSKMIFETNKEFVFKDEVQLDTNNSIHIIKNTDEQKYDSIVILNISIFTSKSLSDVPFRMDVEVEGHFMWNDKLAEDTLQLDSMLKQNAPAILYSYLRPIITLITVEANIPPLVIPLMNFSE
jgi:preprotein translocase subunit SecB